MPAFPDRFVYHIAEAGAWFARPDEAYVPSHFREEGFIHLSYRSQIAATALRYYAGRDGLVLLTIDPALLSVELIDENLVGADELFPHLYAPLPRAAVRAVAPITWDAHGQMTTAL